MKQNRILGSKIFGFLLICSFSAIFAACGTSNSAGAAGAGTTKSCPANSNLNNCSLAQANHGDSNVAGTCITGYAGTCGYTCDNGEWAEDSNSCALGKSCPANSNMNNCSLEAASHDDSNGTCARDYTGTCGYTCDNGEWAEDSNLCLAPCLANSNLNNCSLEAASHDDSNGTCARGYAGTCGYTCNDGEWAEDSNSCALGKSCPANSNMNNCSLEAASHDDSNGTCITGYLGTCSYTCNDGMWEQPTDMCLSDMDNDGIADTNDFCMISKTTDFTSGLSNDIDRDGCEDAVEDVDDDGNGLIEITTPAMLDDMRYNLRGTSYDDEEEDDPSIDSSADEGDKTGCGGQTTGITECNGYELDNDITLAGTWDVITGTFLGTFDGQGYSISGLIISSGNVNVGFFANVSGLIRNIHLTGSTTVTSTSGNSNSTAGSLVGVLNSGGRVFSSSSTLSTTGNDGVGGLVGWNTGGTIRNSYATGNANGGSGDRDRVGGLVGWNTGTIRNSYATGNADGGSGGNDYVGGLVGINSGGTIRNSYATGNANGGAGLIDHAGGLAGENINSGTAPNSYRNSEATIESEIIPNTLGTARTMTELQSGTGTEYTDWSTNDWNFGTSTQYPALRSYETDSSQQGALLCSQPSPRAQCPP